MARLRNFARSSSACSIVLSILIFTTLCFATAADRITRPIVATQTVRLAAGVPLKAQPQFDQGPVDRSFKLSYMTLLTMPSASQQKAIDKLLAQQQNPHSSNYHKWLTPEQYADRFGLSPNDMRKLTAWLQSEGFSVVRTARGRNWIVFSGTASQVENVFQTQLHTFKVDGETHFANITAPSIPAALSGIVSGIRGLNNFWPKSQAHQAVPGYTFPFQGNSFLFLAPGDIAAIYDVKVLYNSSPPIDGTGQKLAVMGQTGIFQSDLTDFRKAFGLSAISCTTSSDKITSCNTSNFKYILVNGSATTVYGDIAEADIDVEWSGATARNAQVIYVNSTDPNGFGVWDSWYYAVDNDVAPVITMSYTTPCELAEAFNSGSGKFTYVSDEAELAQANLEGITFMNSSGDTGAAECDFGSNFAQFGYAAAYPASSQYVTGVGGTSIPAINPDEYNATYWNSSNGSDGGSAKGYIPEQPWNDAQEIGLICSLNPVAFCTDFGITDWSSAQAVIGLSSGGGGISNCKAIDPNGVCQSGFPQPSWQSGIDASAINPNGVGGTSTPARYSPDVSLLASPNFPGYLICTQKNGPNGGGSSCASGISGMLNACFARTGPCTIFGGTSVSSPVFAGMVTLLNQYLNGSNSPGLGNINPTLYSLAAANSNNHAFNPVTTDSNGSYSNGAFCAGGTPSNQPGTLQCPNSGPNAGFLGFNAYDSDSTTNYNLVTGLGSVDLNNLAVAWAGAAADFTMATSGPNSATLLAGESASYTFTVTPTGGSGVFAAPVSFSCSSFLPADPTLTNASCAFNTGQFNPTIIAAGTSGPVSVTLTVTTAGPNQNTSAPAQKRRRADNRLPWVPLTLPLAGILFAGVAGRKVSKYSLVGSLCVALVLLGLLVACGGGSSSSNNNNSGPPAISVSVAGTPSSVFPNDTADGWPSQTAQFTATVHNSTNQSVTWSVTGGDANGTIDANGLYTAPQVATGLPSKVTIVATSAADTSKSGSAQETLKPATVPQQYTVNVTATSGGTALTPVPVTLNVQ